MKKLCAFILFVVSSVLYAQDQNVTGLVVDNEGIPVAGATVLVKGTSKGAVTDFDGNFSINNIPSPIESKILLISYLGYETKSITIGDSRKFNVTLQPDTEGLDEVVVVGYGTVRKSDLTGSVSSVKAEDITVAGAIGLDQALTGRAAGVVVTQNSGEPGTGASIRIRAISSLNDSEPLYVIDGIPMENTNAESLQSDFESSQLSPLSLIDPSDIESIEILKDASSTAIYGSRGANGVVLITTKKGKVGKGVVNITHEQGIVEIPRYIDLLDSNQYAIINNEARINNGGVLTDANVIQLNNAYAGAIETNDWQRSATEIGNNSNTSISFSGGNEDVRYLLSSSLLDSKGIIPNSDFDRISTRLNVNANISERFKVGANINYSHTESGQTNNGAFTRALRVSPITGINDFEDGIDDTLLTPLTQVTSLEVNTLLTQIIGSLTAEYNFTDALSFKTQFTHQNRNIAQRYYQFNRLPENAAEGGRARTLDTRSSRTTVTNTLNFSKVYGKSRINAVLGQSVESTERESIRVSNFGFANDFLTYFAPGTATFFDPDRVTYADTKLASFFGRVNYSLNNKYLFTLTGRYDGSSKFAANNKWAFFPAAAFAYNLSNEKFMKKINAISQAKFRVSYGTSGNQAIGPYESLDQYQADFVAFNEQNATIFYQEQLPSPDLTWETTTQLDVGLDLGFLKNRFTLTFDYYNKTTDALLFPQITIPVQSGFAVKSENDGSLETNGFEVAINARIINTDKFSWRVRGNLSTGKTKVTHLAADNLFSGWDPGFISGGTQRLIIGEEIGTFWGYKRAGISQFDDFVEFQGVSEEDRINIYNANPTATYTYVDDYSGGYPVEAGRERPGEQLYEDIDSDGAITGDDRQAIGQAQPDVMFGIDNSFTIGGFDFSFFIDAQINKDMVAVHNYNGLNFLGQQGLDVVFDRWTPENPSNIWPRVAVGTPNLFSDRYIEDATFVRLQNVTLGYNLPSDITKKLKISSLRVYASATNVALWTSYTGFSPDVSLRGSSATNLGHDNARYPATRLIRLGVNLKF